MSGAETEALIADLAAAIRPEQHGARYPEDRDSDTVSFRVSMPFGLLRRLGDAARSASTPTRDADTLAQWSERLQEICERAGCPPGINRFDFIEHMLRKAALSQTSLPTKGEP